MSGILHNWCLSRSVVPCQSERSPLGGYGMTVTRVVPYRLILVMACPWYGNDDIVLVALADGFLTYQLVGTAR